MSRQFSQESLYDDPAPPLWRRLLPIFIVLCAGAAAYYWGTSAGERMAGQIQNTDLAQADTALVERAVIGENAPEIMMPNATPAPAPIIVETSPGAVKSVKPRRTTDSKPKPTPVPNPFEDNSIPFRPAEDYPPGVERPIEPPNQPDDAPMPDLKPEKTSPIPVPEKPSESAAKQ